MNKARVFVRIVECDDGTWEWHRGRAVVGFSTSFGAALDAATGLAVSIAPSALFVHTRDGKIERLASYDA
jgi:hypothetical protein